MDVRCFQSTKWMVIYWSFFLSDFSLRIMILLSSLMAWKEKKKKPNKKKHPCNFICCLCVLLIHTHIPVCVFSSLSFLSFVAFLHKSCQTQRLSLHMSVSKVSVTELQWNPNCDVNVTAALILQAPTWWSMAQLFPAEFLKYFHWYTALYKIMVCGKVVDQKISGS